MKKKKLGLSQEEFSGEFLGHDKKITALSFHYNADNILITGAGDNLIKLWDIEKCKEMINLKNGNSSALSFSWNFNGSTFATTSSDRSLRIFDARSDSIIKEVITENQGGKGFKVMWTNNENRLITVGVTKNSDRQINIWDIKNLDNPLNTYKVDATSASIIPYYDPSISTLYFAGRGESIIKLYLITDEVEELCIHNNFNPISGLYPLHKTEVDVRKHQTMSFLKLEKTTVEPIDFFVPRKSEYFQDDLFPECPSYDTPSLKSSEWFDGKTENPTLISLQPDDMSAESMVEKKEKLKPKYDFKAEQDKIEKLKNFNQNQIKVMDTVNQYDFSDDDEKEKELPDDW